jgi:hypothetical protein
MTAGFAAPQTEVPLPTQTMVLGTCSDRRHKLRQNGPDGRAVEVGGASRYPGALGRIRTCIAWKLVGALSH